MWTWVRANWHHVVVALVAGLIAANTAFRFVPTTTMNTILAVLAALGLYSRPRPIITPIIRRP